RPFEADIGRDKDKLRVYEAQKVAADKEEARLRALEKKGGASTQQVEKAEADAKALDASISGAKNEIARAELELEYSRITADIGGRISKAGGARCPASHRELESVGTSARALERARPPDGSDRGPFRLAPRVDRRRCCRDRF